MNIEDNTTKEVTPVILTAEKPTITVDTTALATDVNTTKTKAKLEKLLKTTPEVTNISATANQENINKNNTSTIVKNALEVATIFGMDKNTTNTIQTAAEDKTSWLYKVFDFAKKIIPVSIQDWFANLFKEKDHGISNDTRTTTPSNTTPTAQDFQNFETKKESGSKITQSISELITEKTRTDINEMLGNSSSVKTYISAKEQNYTALQKHLRLKSAETIGAGSKLTVLQRQSKALQEKATQATHKGTFIVMKLLENKFPKTFMHSAAVNDDFHHRLTYHSNHTEGKAFDYTLKINKGENQKTVYAHQFTKIRNFLQTLGLNTNSLKDECNHPSGRSTAPHLHFEFKEDELDKVYAAFSQA